MSLAEDYSCAAKFEALGLRRGRRRCEKPCLPAADQQNDGSAWKINYDTLLELEVDPLFSPFLPLSINQVT
jgi:hypothetical protein